MSSAFKLILLIILAIIFLLINTYYNGIIIRAYNWITGLPKMLLIFITLTIIFAPFLLKNNKAVDLCKDFLPDSISKRIDIINATKTLQMPQQGHQQGHQQGGYSSNLPTSKLRKVSEQLKKIVASKQKWGCKNCKNILEATYEIDHIIALEDGGSNNIDNLQALCRNCHGKKTMEDNIKRRYPNGKL
jgi:5-methylcytosine-specific restriction endonuclease McrA